jgi:hypothetical protein
MSIQVVVVRGVARAEGVDACCLLLLLLSSAITICSCISLQKVHVTAPHLLTGHPNTSAARATPSNPNPLS